MEHFKVNQGFIIDMEWESLSHPYGRCAHKQIYIDGLQSIIYHQTIPVKRKQRDAFPLKACYQSNIVANSLCKIFLTSLCNLHNVQNLELKINWGFMKGSDMKIQRQSLGYEETPRINPNCTGQTSPRPQHGCTLYTPYTHSPTLMGKGLG